MNNKKFTIAIAEDKQEDIAIIKEAFKPLSDYEILITAVSGKTLIKALHKLKKLPDLVLMDMQMPNCDGLTATIICKLLYPNLKIVGLSSHSYESVICEFMAEGGNGFLSKHIVQSHSALHKFAYNDVDIFEKILKRIIVDNEVYFDPLCHYTGKEFSSIVTTKSVFEKHYKHLSKEQILLLHLNQATFSQTELVELLSQSLSTIKRKFTCLYKIFNAENHCDLMNVTQMLNITKTVKLFQMYV